MRGYPHGLFTHLKLVDVTRGGVEVGVGHELSERGEHAARGEFLVGGDTFFKLFRGDTNVQVDLIREMRG